MDDLEALFEQISEQRAADEAAKTVVAAPAPTPVPAPVPAQISQSNANAIIASHTTSSDVGEPEAYDIFQRVGQLTRNLHDALRELGYDKKIDSAVGALPDARARLAYIANVTGQAAEKVLAAVEKGQSAASVLENDAVKLRDSWDRLFAKNMSIDEFKKMAHDTHDFFKKLPSRSGEFNGLFLDIMMAQDFHDLTGQVIGKIATLAENLEKQLLQLLLDTTPPNRRAEVSDSWLNGPVINSEGRTDIVTNQTQVDDLLASLGF